MRVNIETSIQTSRFSRKQSIINNKIITSLRMKQTQTNIGKQTIKHAQQILPLTVNVQLINQLAIQTIAQSEIQ